MKCSNCSEINEDPGKFCVYCGEALVDTTGSPGGYEPVVSELPEAAKQAPVMSRENSAAIVMRAGEGIWEFEEQEGDGESGGTKPILILDEQIAYLAHTERKLAPGLIFERVENAARLLGPPVEVKLVDALWLNDGKESRKRIVASLKDSSGKDLKSIMGLDYLDNWASFQMAVGYEPEATKKERKPPKNDYVLFAGIAGVAAFMYGMIGEVSELMVAGFLAVAGALFTRLAQNYKSETSGRDNKSNEESRAMRSNGYRNYQRDDLRLFVAAMDEIYRTVINDIVEQGGGRVVRIEGGKGSLFRNGGSENGIHAG